VSNEIPSESEDRMAPVPSACRVRGGKQRSQKNVYHVLTNRKYSGQIVHKGKAYPGEHEAIVSVEQFERVTALRRAWRAICSYHGWRIRATRSHIATSPPVEIRVWR